MVNHKANTEPTKIMVTNIGVGWVSEWEKSCLNIILNCKKGGMLITQEVTIFEVAAVETL